MSEWRFLTTTFERGPLMRRVEGELKEFPLVIGKVRVWEHDWGPTLETIEVIDPRGNHRFASVYEIQAEDGSTARFAATEFSNGVYGFFVPASN